MRRVQSEQGDDLFSVLLPLHCSISRLGGGERMPLYSLSITEKVVSSSWLCCVAILYKTQDRMDRKTNPLVGNMVPYLFFI